MSELKALVIGASGLLGSALQRALEHSGIAVVGTYYARRVDGALQLDIRDAHEVKRCVESMRPDFVFLAVNMDGGVDHCEAHPDEADELIVVGSKNVADAVSRVGARLVYYSTDYVFDGVAGPYSENDDPCPINAYGRAKSESEKVVQLVAPESLIVRTTAVFGWDVVSRNFAMQIWEQLQAGNAMRVPDDQWCNPTLADYLAEVSLRLSQLGTNGILNVVGTDRMPRSELARALARTMALDPELIVPVPTSELNQTAARPLNGGLNTDRLQELLGTKPLNLSESLKRFRRHWRASTHVMHGPKPTSNAAEALKREIFDKVEQYYEMVHNRQEFVPFKTRVPYSGRVFGSQEMVNLVDSALDFWLTLGPYGELFERKMKQYFRSKDFVLVNSGSTANLTAIMTLMSPQLEQPLKAGDEVITPATTFPTTLAPIVHSGLIPVFVDCEVETLNINPDLLEDALSQKTRALMIPHTLGNPCDMDIICDIARRHDLYLIEDSCDALGATFRDRLVGTFGDLATLSFYPAHHITMGEGGGVIVNTHGLSRIVRSVRDWGRDCWCAAGESNTCGKRFGWQLGNLPRGYDHKYTYSNLGYNFKPTDMQAAIGVAQADRIPSVVERRRHHYSQLFNELAPYGEYLVLPRADPRSNPSWFAFPITVRNGVSRDALVHWLENAGIETRQLFAGNIVKQPGYRNMNYRISGSLEQTDVIMHNTFFVGVFPGLTDEMIQFVARRFAEFFDSAQFQGRNDIKVSSGNKR